MPVNRHLQWAEIRDFAPGLWEGADWLMPANAAQQLTDAYPQVGGGLRAFFRGSTLSTSGIVAPTNERVLGLHARGGVPMRSGSPGDGVDRYLLTYLFDAGAGVGTKARPRLYRMDGSNAETTWTQIFDTAGSTEFANATSDNNAPQKASFRFFRLSSGAPNDLYVLMVLRYIGADNGLWRLNYNDLSSAQKAIKITTAITNCTDIAGAIATHQARVVGTCGNSEKVAYSNPGTVTFDAANSLDVEPNQDLPVILAIHAIAPDDLLTMKEGGPWALVQGDITNPTIQQMGEGIHPGGSGFQDFGRTPDGLSFIATDGGVYLTNGYEFTNLSEQLAGFNQQVDFVGPGDTNYLGEFLFAPLGYVYHFPTKSWFKQSVMQGAVHNVERYTRKIWGPTTTGTSFGLVELQPFPDTARLNTYTWKSAPIRGEDGRQIEIQEVEVYLKAYDTASCTVTVNGVVRTVSNIATGRQKVSFLFNGLARGEVLDVTVQPSAGNAANEAPSIETIRIGYRSGHQTY